MGKEVYLPGNTSAYMNVETALKINKSTSADTVFVLFVFLMKNYSGFSGVRLNKDQYSAFPSEEEFLIIEGSPATVLSIDQEL